MLFPTVLSWQVLLEGSLTSLLYAHQLTFGLRGFSGNKQKITIQGSLKSQTFKQWELAQLARHETLNTRNVKGNKTISLWAFGRINEKVE